MKRSKAYGFLLLSFTLLLLYCKKPFNPQVVSADDHYLVVEGVITGQQGITSIKLSRTVKLDDSTRLKPETGATVSIETDQQGIYTLTGDGKGNYTSAQLTLPTGPKYRIHIITTDGKEYASDYVPMKITPQIDSVNYTPQGEGVQIYVNTHDATNNTRYYRWGYQESWIYTGAFSDARMQYKNHQLAFLEPDSLRYYCYRFYTPPNGIYVGSSARLSQDVVSHQPINYVAAATGKLTITYSVLINQYALTEDALNYWQNLKKNTEQLGSVFDAQPSTLAGNLHCISNTAEVVLGYISASSVTSKRIFINGYQLPFYVPLYSRVPASGLTACTSSFLPIEPRSTFDARAERVFASGDTLPIAPVYPPGSPVLTGYSYGTKFCVDCRQQGGTSIKPSYWP